MTRVLGSLWLAARFARGSRKDVAGQAVLFATAFLLTFLALGTAAAPQVVAHRTDRSSALTPITDLSDEKPSQDALLVFEPRASGTERWNGHQVLRQYFAAGGAAAPRIPGTTTAPGVGEYLASPALSELIDEDETVAALFETLRPVGTITPDGLVDPHEHRAIIGIPRHGPLLQPVVSFGGHAGGSHDEDRVLNTSIAGLSAAMIWLPALALVAVVTRLRAGSRRQRFRSLRNLGLSVWTARLVEAAECTVVALPGATLGAVMFAVAAGRVSHVPGTSYGFFSADMRLSLAALLAATSVVWLLLAAAAGFSHRDDASKSRRLYGLLPRVEAVGLTIVVVAVGFLLALPVLQRIIGTPAVFGMWIACAGAAVGLAVAGPAIVERISLPASRRVQSAAAMVGIRMGHSVTASTTRLGSLACVVVVLMLGCLSFIAILNGGTYSNWNDRLAQETKIPIVVTDLTGRLQFADIEQLELSDGLAQVQQTSLRNRDVNAANANSGEDGAAGNGVQLVFASCQDLTDLIGRAPDRCDQVGLQWFNKSATSVAAGSTVDVPGHGSLPVPSATQVALVRGLPSELDGAILVDPRLAPSEPTTDSRLFFVLADPSHVSTSMASLSSLVPGLQFDLGELGRANPDFRRFPNQIEWLIVGCLASFLIAALALLGSLLGEAPQRARRLRGLRILGATRSTLIRSHLWSTAFPLTVLGATASFIGLVVCMCLRSFDDRATIPWAAAAYSVAGCTALALLLGLATARSSLNHVGRSGGIEG